MTKGAWGANADEGGDCGGGETGDEEEVEVEVESGAASGRRPMGTMERSCFAGRSGSAGWEAWGRDCWISFSSRSSLYRK
jgi:hypothetical protein